MIRAGDKTVAVSDRIRLAELALDCLVCSFISAGLSFCLLHWFALEWAWTPVWLSSLGLTGLTGLLSRRWFIAPAAGLLIMGGAGGWLWQSGQLDETIAVFLEFIIWSQTRLQIGPVSPEYEIWSYHLRFLLLLPAVLLWFALIRRIDNLVFHVVVLLLMFTPLLLYYPQTLPGLLIALAGLIMQLPRHFVRIIRRQKEENANFSRVPLQLLALPVAVSCVLMASWLVPAQTRHWRWAAIVHPINDIADLITLQSGQPRSWTDFVIGAYGYQPLGARLGGPARLSGGRVLQIYADRSFLLKGSSRGIYTGFSWEKVNASYHRLGSGLWRVAEQRTFLHDLPGGAAGAAFRRRFSLDITLNVESLTGGMAAIFSAGRVRSVELDNMLDFPVYFTTAGDLFVFGGLPRGTVYQIRSEYFDRSQDGFDQALLALEREAADSGDNSRAFVRALYMQLPAELPGKVRDIARSAVSPEAGPYQKAIELESFLRENFKYTLTPDEDPGATDFVAGFLNYGEGYCVHFASAMVVMARTLDIPARYVEGFIMKPINDDNSSPRRWLATGTEAHAWAELYFDGIGWLTFDPTPATQGELPSPSPTPTPAVTPVLSPAVTPIVSLTPTPPPADNGLNPQAVAAIWLFLLPVLLIILTRLGPRLAILHHRRLFDDTAIARRWPMPAERLDFHYRDLLRQLECLDIRPEPGETLLEFSLRAEHYLRFENDSLSDVLWPVIRWRYGAIEPAGEELTAFSRLRRRLEERLIDSMGRSRYLFKRVLRATGGF